MYNFLVIDGIPVFAGIMYFIFTFAKKAFRRASGRRLTLCALVIILSVFFESWFDVDLIWADYSLNLLFLTAVVNCYYSQPFGL